MKRFSKTNIGKKVRTDLGNAFQFLFSPPGTLWSASGAIIFGGMMYFGLNTCEWSALREESKRNVNVLQKLLDGTPVESEARRRQILIELEIQKQFRRETWFPMFNPPRNPPKIDYAAISNVATKK